MAFLQSTWLPVPFIIFFALLRVFNPVHLDVPNQAFFMRDHWTAPLTLSNLQATNVNPVSSFHCSTNLNRPKILPPLGIKNKLNIQMSLIALLAGDIEMNPGPRMPKYPCQICHKAAKWGQKAIECEQCCGWHHTSCLNMNDDMYQVLTDHPSYSWICCNCGVPNFSTTFLESLWGFELSNSFSHLENNSSDPALPNTSPLSSNSSPGKPLLASSPKTQNTSNKNDSRGTTIRPNSNRRGKPTSTKYKLSNLKIININCQSVSAKLPLFEAMLSTEDPDIVVGTESWLKNSVSTGEIFPPCYNVFRRDRQSANRGGGVFIAVKNSLIASTEVDLQTDCESVWISIQVKGLSPVYIGAFYRPQSTDRDYILEIDTALSRIPQNASVWLLGDFNLPDIDWDTVSFKPGGRYPAISKLMVDITNDHNLHQVVKEPTRDLNILDLCFTNSPASVDSVQVKDGISDHDFVIVNATLRPKVIRPPKRKIYVYNRADFPGIDSDMIDFDKTLTADKINSHSIEELYSMFKEALFNSINRYIPSKLSSSHFSFPWVNNSVKRDINRKQRLYNKAKKRGHASHWSEFRKLRRSIDRKIRKAHKNYIRDVIGDSLKSDNTKPFWNYVKAKKQEVSGVSPLQVAGRILSSAKDKAEALNRQFCSVFTNENDSNLPDLGSSDIPDINDIEISTEGVLKLLNDLKTHKAAGPDGIPARVLKACSNSIAPILQKLFQKSISTGSLPTDWLNANISPIYKKNDRSAPSNYRPVSLTSIICKLLEHIIHSHIMKHFEEFDILANEQHGFRKGRSCETQLSALVDDLQQILDKRSQADLIIMDFSKAFDTVPHQRLLAKLHHVGIRNNILPWINNFLTKRHQRVVVDGESSQQSPVESGVPQGTVLGPLLFLVFINDLPSNLSSLIRLFADDCILYREIKNKDDSEALQADINRLCAWESTWQMGFNHAKCFTMRVSHKTKPIIHQYYMGNHLLQEVAKHPYLGVELTSDMSWNTHINQIANKANRMLGLIRRNLSCCNRQTKTTAYCALVRPLLEYCHTIWDPHQQNSKDTLEKVQRRAARFIFNDYSRTSSVTNMLQQLEWDKLETRRTRARLQLIYKESHGLIPSNINHLLFKADADHQISRPRTRLSNGHFTYSHISSNKNCYQKSLYPRTIPEWNLLPDSLRCAPTIQSFKTKLITVDVDIIASRAHFKI